MYHRSMSVETSVGHVTWNIELITHYILLIKNKLRQMCLRAYMPAYVKAANLAISSLKKRLLIWRDFLDKQWPKGLFRLFWHMVTQVSNNADARTLSQVISCGLRYPSNPATSQTEMNISQLATKISSDHNTHTQKKIMHAIITHTTLWCVSDVWSSFKTSLYVTERF